MKWEWAVCGWFVMASVALAQEGGAVKPQTVKQQASYGIGLSIGRNLKNDAPDVDLELLIQGIRDAVAGKKPQLSEAELRQALGTFQREMAARRQQRMQVAADKNRREGEAFLKANKERPNVVSLESGLQYEVIKRGSGPTPKLSDRVKTHYHGTLIDGTVFDSSVQRNEPAVFPVGGVIRGWTEALQRMKVGDKWRLYVPSELAYGQRGAGADIGPNAVLIFDIELLGIE